MAVSKVTLKEGNERKTLIDLTQDTAVESDVAQGKTFHKSNGEIAVGTASGSGSSNKLPDFIEDSLTSILPEDLQGVIHIGERGISYKNNLLNVSLPASIQFIGNFGMANNINLEEIVIAEGTEILGSDCFSWNIALTTIYLPSTLIDEGVNAYLGAFNGCVALTDVYYNSTKADWEVIDPNIDLFGSSLPQQVTIHCTDGNIVVNEPVGNMVLTLQDTTTKTISVMRTISENLDTYKDIYEFSLSDVVSITLPSGVAHISEGFALGCENLINVTLPDTLQEIPNSAFDGTKLANIDLPGTITEIGYNAFAYQNYGGDSPINITITCRATVPPYSDYTAFNQNPQFATITAIYVPVDSVTDYRQDTNWSRYASLIQAIPQV